MSYGINYIGRAYEVTFDTPYVEEVPVRYPPQLEEAPADPGNTGKGLTMVYSGTVLDQQTGNPLPGASVYLLSGGLQVTGMPTDASGQFNLPNVDAGGDTIRITHTGYKAVDVKAAQYQNANHYIILMERDIVELDPVELPGGSGDNNMLWLLLLAGGVIASQGGKKSVGKIDLDTAIVIGGGAVLFFGFDVVKKLFENIGFWKSPGEKSYDEEANNPYSFWSPRFWEQGGDGTLLLTHAKCTWLYDEIYDSFGFWDDDESRIYAAFKTLKTQSQLSYFSYWVAINKGTDLLDWLLATKTGPVGDHLSADEIKVITDYFNKLPKYKV